MVYSRLELHWKQGFLKDPAKSLKSDLRRLQQWTSQCHFNPDKTEVVIVSKNKAFHPPIYLSGNQLKEVQSPKHLGIKLSNDLSGSNYILSVVTIASQRL